MLDHVQCGPACHHTSPEWTHTGRQGSLGATEVEGPGGLAGGVEPGDVPAVRSLRVLPQTPLLTQDPALAGSRTYC